jgi:hypothetical protein
MAQKARSISPVTWCHLYFTYSSKRKVSVVVEKYEFGFFPGPRQKSLAPSVASVTSIANDQRVVLRSPGICLTAEENPKKP